MDNEQQEKYIRYREDRNSYEVQLRPKVDGKTISIVRTAKTMDKAKEIRDDLMDLYKMDKSLLLAVASKGLKREPKADPNKPVNLKENILKWYKFMKRVAIEDSTIESYDTMLFVHVIPILGTLDVKKIDSETMQIFFSSLLKNGNKHEYKKGNELSIKYVKKIKTFVKSYFSYLVSHKIIFENPCDNVKLPRQPKVERPFFKENDKRTFMKYLKRHNYNKYFLFKIYFETGCRRGEILGIPWKHIDFNKGGAFIKPTVVKDIKNFKGKLKGTPKTDASIRWVWFSDSTMFGLRMMYESQERTELDFSGDTLVFHKKDGSCYTPGSISQSFKRYVRILGLDDKLTLHSTRHTMAKILLKNRVPLPTIQRIGGWGNATTLLNTYGHSEPEEDFGFMQYLSI